MKRTAKALAVIGLLGSASTSQAQPAIDSLKEAKALWLNRNFAGAYEALVQYRETPFGRTFEVDFMLGTCACRMEEKRKRGAEFLEWVVTTYGSRLTPEGRRVVENERQACSRTVNTSALPAPPAERQLATAGGRYQGKVFYWLNRDLNESTGLANALAESSPLPEATIRARWIARGDRTGAARIAQQALPGAKVSAFSRFVIVSRSNHTRDDMANANRLLEKYLDFFVRSYGMKLPGNYMFVYLVSAVDDLRALAKRHHSMTLSYGTIAYSFRDDLSIAAVIPGKGYGSLFHELFHLVARTNFGDIPPWLDEGIAALYEVSRLEGNDVKGVPNWRGEVLARFKDRIPSLHALITRKDSGLADADDRSYRGEFEGIQQQATYAATARYFALYLQEENKLFSTYSAVRGFSTSDEFTGTAEGVVRLIERSTGKPIGALDRDFRGWLSRQSAGLKDIPLESGPHR